MEIVFDHIGINHENEEHAHKDADILENAFGMSRRQGHGYVFMDKTVELRESKFYGECGHIAFSVIDVEQALEQLKEKEITPIEASIVKNADGKIVSVYLDVDINGFAIHLVKRR